MPRSRKHSASHGLSPTTTPGARSVRVHSRNPVAGERGSDQGEGAGEGSAGRPELRHHPALSAPILAQCSPRAPSPFARATAAAARQSGGEVAICSSLKRCSQLRIVARLPRLRIVGEAVADQLGRTLDVPRRDAVLDRRAEVQAFGVPGARPAVQPRLALRLTVTQLRLEHLREEGVVAVRAVAPIEWNKERVRTRELAKHLRRA